CSPFFGLVRLRARSTHLPYTTLFRSAVAHHLYEWDIRFNDPALIARDLNDNPVEDVDAPHFADKLFRHFNFGAELTLARRVTARSEEHTSELQSRENLVCRLLLEKKH